jgi:hypothetical protein
MPAFEIAFPDGVALRAGAGADPAVLERLALALRRREG